MKVLIAYYSLTGNTEKAAKALRNAFSKKHKVDLLRIETVEPYSIPLVYLTGSIGAMFGKKREVKEEGLDWSGYDLVILGTPVWAGHPTPPMNDYISRAKGTVDRKVLTFVTYSGSPGATEKLLEEKIEERDAMLLDFGEIRMTGPWGEKETNAAVKMAEEFLEVLSTQPREISFSGSNILLR